MFLGKDVLNICSKFTGEHPCQSAICELLCNFIEIALWHRCSPVNLLHIFKTPFLKNTYGWLLVNSEYKHLELTVRKQIFWNVWVTKFYQYQPSIRNKVIENFQKTRSFSSLVKMLSLVVYCFIF